MTKEIVLGLRTGFAALAIFAAALLSVPQADAQTVTQLPIFTGNNTTVKDLGNGPTEIRITQGNAQVWTMQGSGLGNASASPFITLTTTPTTLPCVGCILSGTGITSGTTVIALVGGAGTQLQVASNVTLGTNASLAWGAACPATVPTNLGIMLIQAQVDQDLPLYTQSRICAAGQNTVGGNLLTFPVGAH